MNAAVERLTRVVPPPADVRAKDWTAVVRELGVELPGDYRELVDTYGGGCFDGYLWLLEPWSVNDNYDLLTAERERSEAFEELWEMGEPRPAALDEPDARLIPWASTDNGEFLYWLARPAEAPQSWPVMVNEARGEEWERFETGCTEFLVSALTREIRSDLLSSRFPRADHEFRRPGDLL